MNDDRNILERRGRLELSKTWPDGSRYRRPFPNRTLARQMRARIEVAIATGTWRQLKEELSLKKRVQIQSPNDRTIAEYAPHFLEEMRRRNRCPEFHEIQIRNIVPIVGDVRLKDFTRADALKYRAARPLTLSPATINRGVAVLRALLSFAVEEQLLPSNPLFGFEDYAEPEREMKVMTMDEERAFVAALLEIDLAIGVYAGVMGETAIRTEEALRLTWPSVDLHTRTVTVPAAIAKTKKARHVPISDFCKDLFGLLPRVVNEPHVFVKVSTLQPVKDTRAAFRKAQERTGLRIHPEHFRHFRITQWMSSGIDPRTVQELAGHADIHTTMRYAHFAPGHASRLIIETQRAEAATLRQLMIRFEQGTTTGPKRDRSVSELERLYAMEAGK